MIADASARLVIRLQLSSPGLDVNECVTLVNNIVSAAFANVFLGRALVIP